ncbi:MAG: CARDB domain-containing protein [Acidobacteriota bacterium]
MEHRTVIVAILCSLLCMIPAAAGNLWVRTFDTSGSADEARSVVETADGGLCFLGKTSPESALRIVKISSTGVLEWQRSYGYGSAFFTVRRLIQTSDGGFAVAGDVMGDKGLLLRFSGSGSLLWQRMYGGTSSGFYDVEETDDGGFILAGSTGDYDVGSGDTWVVKTDSSGEVVWAKAYGGTGAEEHGSAEQTSDGGYIVSAQSDSFGSATGILWLLKLDSTGTPVWQRQYDGGDWMDGFARPTAEGGYIVSGWIGGAARDAILMKLTSSGSVSWARTYGGGDDDVASPHPATCSDGGFLVAGTTRSFGAGGRDAWMFKTDSSGSLMWQRSYGSSGDDDVRDGPIETGSHGAALAGTYRPASVSDAFLLRTTSSGDVDPSCGSTVQIGGATASTFTPAVSDTTATVTPISLTAIPAGMSETVLAMTTANICTSPDLADLTGSFTKLRRKGSAIKVTFSCRNIGTLASGSFNLKIYLAGSPTVGRKANLIATKSIGPLAPGATAAIKANGQKTSKTKYVVAVIDTTSAVVESDEGNNKIAASVP